MGQRSQIYIRIKEGDKRFLIANYYQWNYGERMVSRARHTIDWIADIAYPSRIIRKVGRVADVNFDMIDVADHCNIIEEWKEYSSDEELKDVVFYGQDNNDGKLFIDVDGEDIRYAFTDAEISKPMDAEEYLKWDFDENWRETIARYEGMDALYKCFENIGAIKAKLMTQDELTEFIETEYEYDEREFAREKR